MTEDVMATKKGRVEGASRTGEEAEGEVGANTAAADNRLTHALVDICLAGDRSLAAPALPPEALCFTGVGYDEYELGIYKFMPAAHLKALKRDHGREEVEP